MTEGQMQQLTDELDTRLHEQIRRIVEDDMTEGDLGLMRMLSGVMQACEDNPLLGMSIQACYPMPNALTN